MFVKLTQLLICTYKPLPLPNALSTKETTISWKSTKQNKANNSHNIANSGGEISGINTPCFVHNFLIRSFSEKHNLRFILLSNHFLSSIMNHPALYVQPKFFSFAVNSNVTKAECVDGETIKVYKKEYDFDKFQCKYTAKGTVKKSKKQCGNEQGHIIHIGYQVVKKEWTSLIDVCYSDNKGITLYSEHTLYGASIKGKYIGG